MVGVPLLGLLLGITLGLWLRPKRDAPLVPPILPLTAVALTVILLLVVAADMMAPTPSGLLGFATVATLPGGLVLMISMAITYGLTNGKS